MFHMKILRLFTLLLTVAASNVYAQTNYGGEIVSYNTFGEGMMVTRAKIVPLSGTVTNIFFFNRVDQPWNNNVWYEYDWEIRGKSPFSGESSDINQIVIHNRTDRCCHTRLSNYTVSVSVSYTHLTLPTIYSV